MENSSELLNSFGTWVKDKGKSENTVTTYKGVLQKFYQWLIEERKKDIIDVTKDDVQAYMIFLDEEQNRSASTIDKVFATIRVFTQFLGKPELVQNIKKKAKERNIYQTPPEVLKENEKTKILKQVEIDGNLRNTAIIYTLLYTGIRISELCALNHSDIEMKDQKGILIVSSQEQKERVIPLSKEVMYHLKIYIDSLETRKGPLFVSNSKQRLSTRAIQYVLNNYKINPLKLRHTFCQELIDKGVDLSIVAQLAGHSDINMTKRYKKHSSKNAEQAFA